MDLHGRVKMLVEKDYFLDTTGKDKGKELRWTKIYRFDTVGRLTELRDLGEHDELRTKSTFAYNGAGRLSEEIYYYNDTTEVPHKTVYTYNKDGLNVSIKNFAPNLRTDTEPLEKQLLRSTATELTAASETIKVYNQKRLLTREVTRYTPDTRSSTIYACDSTVAYYSYDKTKRKIKCAATDRHNFRQTTTYSYDKDGNCILEQADTAKEHEEIKTVSKFDEQGNLIEQTSYESDGSIHSQKKIEYKSFDKTGNWLVEYLHWKDLGTTVIERSIEYYR